MFARITHKPQGNPSSFLSAHTVLYVCAFSLDLFADGMAAHRGIVQGLEVGLGAEAEAVARAHAAGPTRPLRGARL